MDEIFFKPWVGKNYKEGGLFSKRIFILGESHYQWDENIPLTQNLTIECIEEQIEGNYSKQFWTNICITFLNKKPSIEDKYNFWHSGIFYIFIQYNVGFGARVRPTEEMWANSQKGFLEVLQFFKPQCCIVLGYELWEKLPSIGVPGPTIYESEQKETWKYPLSDGNFMLAYGILHPSAGFSGWYWHPFVMKAIDMA